MVKLIVGKPDKVKVDTENFRVWLDESKDGFMGGAGPELILVEEGKEPDGNNVIIWLDPYKKVVCVYSTDIEELGWAVEIM